jgi:NAD(P)H-dependent flavin oxidoreductase YrpB (nitropropane dioxygenase family)
MTSRPFGGNVLLGGPHLPVPEDALVDACIAEEVPVLSLFWGDPTPYVEKAQKAGTKVCDQAGSVRTAKRAADAGVDFIIAQGVEAGGHIAGTVGTMVLTPRVVETVSPIPVVTAGGIADGRGLAAALMLGAEGVVLGTRLIASTESKPTSSTKRRFSRRQKKIPCAPPSLATVGRTPTIVPCALPLLSSGYLKKGAVQNSARTNPS